MKFLKWKLYLYDLAKRIRLIKDYSFGTIISIGDVSVAVRGMQKYGKGGKIRRNLKVIWMYEFAKTVLSKRWRSIATEDELRVATKIYYKLKPIKLEIIMSEIKIIKKYAEEVGLSSKKIANMDEDELIRAIVGAIDADKTYSKQLVAWYDDLPEEYFEEDTEPEEEEKPTVSKKEKEVEKKPTISAKKLEKLLDAISEAEDIKELKEILEDNDELFPAKIAKGKDFEELQEAMVEHLEESEPEKEEKPVSKKKIEKEVEPEEEKPVSKKKAVDNSKLIKEVNKAEDVDDLKAIHKENAESFPGVHTRGIQKFENLQIKMLRCLGVVDEEPEEEKEVEEEKPVSKKRSVSTESDDIEEIAKLPIPFLKKKAKELGIKTLPGMSKDKIMVLIAEKLEVELPEKEEEEPVSKKKVQKEEVVDNEIDQTFVNKLVKAKDIDALIEAAGELGVKINILDKKSAKRLGAKLVTFLSENEKEEETPKKKEKKVEKVSVYKEIEKLVLDGVSEKKIVIKVTPIFEEKGMDDEDYIAKRVKQLVAIVKFDNDMED
jgi:hypothetical protein